MNITVEYQPNIWSNTEKQGDLNTISYFDDFDRYKVVLSCDHLEAHIETYERDTIKNGEYDIYLEQGLVCNDCDQGVDLDYYKGKI